MIVLILHRRKGSEGLRILPKVMKLALEGTVSLRLFLLTVLYSGKGRRKE